MKRSVFLLFALLAATVLCLSGCSDFGFNPIGTWTLNKDNVYLDSELIESVKADDVEYMKSATLTFNKSGTGYIGSDKNANKFTYEYTDDTVTISGKDKHDEEFKTVFEVRDNGKSLVRVEINNIEYNGKTVEKREELIYKK